MRNSSGIYSISEVPSFVNGFWKIPNRDLDPHTPCGVRRGSSALLPSCRNFNPRTPCGVRLTPTSTKQHSVLFQSTHPVWGATPAAEAARGRRPISIHAPLSGCDMLTAAATTVTDVVFQSTHPIRGATQAFGLQRLCCIHFNPRTPCGVRRHGNITPWKTEKFQSTHPLRGATSCAWLDECFF